MYFYYYFFFYIKINIFFFYRTNTIQFRINNGHYTIVMTFFIFLKSVKYKQRVQHAKFMYPHTCEQFHYFVSFLFYATVFFFFFFLVPTTLTQSLFLSVYNSVDQYFYSQNTITVYRSTKFLKSKNADTSIIANNTIENYKENIFVETREIADN